MLNYYDSFFSEVNINKILNAYVRLFTIQVCLHLLVFLNFHIFVSLYLSIWVVTYELLELGTSFSATDTFLQHPDQALVPRSLV